MKIVLIIFFLFLFTRLFAPGNRELIIGQAEKITWDPILRAFMFVESGFRSSVVNSLGYTGILQIGSEMIDEANRICELTGNPDRFTLSDRLDSARSVKCWYVIQNYWNPGYDLKRACLVWNPTADESYYKSILAKL